MFYQKSSVDTIAVFTPYNIGISSLPIFISSATGTDEFISFDSPPMSASVRPTLNGKIIRNKVNSLISGRISLHPQSLSLSAIREIIESQNATGEIVTGSLSITNAGAQIESLYSEFSFTTYITASSIGRKLSDVEIGFTSLPPNTISLGGIISPVVALL